MNTHLNTHMIRTSTPVIGKIVRTGALAMVLAFSGLAAQGAMAKGRCGPNMEGDGPDGKPAVEQRKGHGKHHRKHAQGMSEMGMPGMDMPRHIIKRVFSKLDLTEDQKQQIKSIHQATRDDTKDLRQSMCELRQQMPALADAEPVDEQAIRSLASQMAEVRASLMLKHLQAKKQVEAILTDEQRSKLEQVKEKMRARFIQRREDDNEE